MNDTVDCVVVTGWKYCLFTVKICSCDTVYLGRVKPHSVCSQSRYHLHADPRSVVRVYTPSSWCTAGRYVPQSFGRYRWSFLIRGTPSPAWWTVPPNTGTARSLSAHLQHTQTNAPELKHITSENSNDHIYKVGHSHRFTEKWHNTT